MRRLLLLICSVLLFASCQEKEVIKVSLFDNSLDGTRAYLYLEEDSTNVFSAVDSIEIKDGMFSFTLLAPQDTAIAYVYIPAIKNEKEQKIYFVHEKGTISITVKEGGVTEIVAGKLNADYQSFSKRVAEIRAELKANVSNELKADSLMALQDAVTFEYLDPLMATSLGEYLYVIESRGFTGESARRLLDKALPDFRESVKILSKPLLLQETMVGERFIDIKAQSPDGKRVALSNYVGKGKVVLIDFWASWCPPCRRDMPFIVSLYEKYKEQGLEVVGVSLDSDKKAWTDFIQKTNMTWVQMSDFKKWDSPAIENYNVQSIPYTVLVDREGIIQAEYLSGLDLEEKIQELLGGQTEE